MSKNSMFVQLNPRILPSSPGDRLIGALLNNNRLIPKAKLR